MGRALVIGASGQVGREASAALRAAGLDVVGTSASRPAPGLVPLDLRRLDEARVTVRDAAADLVVLASALTAVDRCEEEPELARAMNAEAPAAIAEAARASGGRTVFLSTEYVFDGRAGPYDEDAPPSPVSVYGRTKLEGERAVLRADPANLALRTTVVYSFHPGDKNFVMQLDALLGAGRRMRVPHDQVSSPTYAPDLGRAIATLASGTARGVLNAAGPDVLGRYDFAVRAARILGLDPALLDAVPTTALAQKAARPLSAGLRTERLRALGIAIRGVDDGLRAFAAARAGGRR
jgi:dTDP-4-dehydrorhamnose reductase